jgi:hypothetical protein
MNKPQINQFLMIGFVVHLIITPYKFGAILMPLNPCEHIKKDPPWHQSHNCGSTSNVVYRKLKAVGVSIFSA